jgi:hypothetical protein
MDRDEQCTVLREGAIAIEGRVAGSSNQALLVTVTLDGLVAREGFNAVEGDGHE